MNKKITTAEELFIKMNPQDGVLPKWAKEFAIEFAKIHCEAQREAIKQDSFAIYLSDQRGDSLIDSAYPFDNIK